MSATTSPHPADDTPCFVRLCKGAEAEGDRRVDAAMRRLATLTLLAALSLASFGCVARQVDLDPGDEASDLEDALGPRVVLLSNPQDSLVGLLGAVIDPSTGVPIPTRRFVVPSSTHSSDLVRYSGMRALSLASGVSTDLFGGFADEEITHVSYDVSIYDSYYLVGAQPYDEGSRCCDEDGVTPSCRAGYVTRVFVGSGTLHYLSERSTEVDFGASIEIHGGRSYRVERERRFTSAVFAVEVASTEAVCERAFCDEREASGACGRCQVLGAQAAVGVMSAPAEGALSLVCSEMRASAETVVSVRGEVHVEDCEGRQAHVLLSLLTEGMASEIVELGAGDGDTSPLSFVRQRRGVAASEGGVLFAELDLRECTCEGRAVRCTLDPDLRLSIDAAPR